MFASADVRKLVTDGLVYGGTSTQDHSTRLMQLDEMWHQLYADCVSQMRAGVEQLNNATMVHLQKRL